jgi:UDP-glucose 4-epimerase
MQFLAIVGADDVPQRIPIIEDHPQRSINPYGHSKLFVERIGFEVAFGLPWMALRYFNAAEADLDGEIGERHAASHWFVSSE